MTERQPLVLKNHCTKCGACCEQGGPALHTPDRQLLRKGTLSRSALYSLRKGERVFENVAQKPMALTEEIVKVRPKDDETACFYYDPTLNTCTIYDHRPQECAALKCWDTAELEALYEKDRLTRMDILAFSEPALKLYQAHEKACAYAKLVEVLGQMEGGKNQAAVKALLGMIQYDRQVRLFAVKNAGVDETHLEFLFGRAFEKTLPAFGFALKDKEGKVYLERL